WQAFYRLQDAGPYLLVDFVVLEEKHPSRFLEPEMHGTPTIYFDRKGLIGPAATDVADFAAKLQKRLPLLEVPAEMFHAFVDKEVRRGRELDALHFYQGLLLNRLVETLRIRYSPWRYNFGMRYLWRDLPHETYAALCALAYVKDMAELPAKKAQAMDLLRRTLAEVRELDLADHLERNR
ncbi:MAG TPA: hypothetical protein VD902_07705, partial [Symbiobacteriaceae bacterium]|nr:hypothetical protein [Symbiobacteriaceae bacterium]